MTPFKSFLLNRVFTGMTLVQIVPPTRRQRSVTENPANG